MTLVEYSSSEDDEPPAKKPKTELPALPSTFRDLYSSTVRASTQDDPTLHGGRKRAVPHVEGNWPAHIYLEWYPDADEQDLLGSILECTAGHTHSLIRNALDVSLPLHVSLSRPLVLRVEQKDALLLSLQRTITTGKFQPIEARPTRARWHLNEDGTRDFLVVQLEQHSDLGKLLQSCNSIAAEFGQPLLYASQHNDTARDEFHVSIGWRLPEKGEADNTIQLPAALDKQLRALSFTSEDVKVRIGQDVTTVPFVKKSNDNTRSLYG